MSTVYYRVEDMMKRSFAETESTKHEVDRKQALAGLQQQISDIKSKMSCSVCNIDISQYYSFCARLTMLDNEIKVRVIIHVL